MKTKPPQPTPRRLTLPVTLGATAGIIATVVAIQFQSVENLIAHTGYGSCGQCNRTWDVVSGHTTNYKFHQRVGYQWFHTTNGIRTESFTNIVGATGMFPLCEACWDGLTPEGRLPFYWENWKTRDQPPSEWMALEREVLGGK